MSSVRASRRRPFTAKRPSLPGTGKRRFKKTACCPRWSGARRISCGMAPAARPRATRFRRSTFARASRCRSARCSTASDRRVEPEHLIADDRDVFTFDLPVTKIAGNRAACQPGRRAGGRLELEYCSTPKRLSPACTRAASTRGSSSLSRPSTRFSFPALRARRPRALPQRACRSIETSSPRTPRSSCSKPRASPSFAWRCCRAGAQGDDACAAQARRSENGWPRAVSSPSSQGLVGFRLAIGFAELRGDLDRGTVLEQPSAAAAHGPAFDGLCFFPGAWELNRLQGHARALMLSSTPHSAARCRPTTIWLLTRVGAQEHVLGVHLGWTHLFMSVPNNTYGLPAHGHMTQWAAGHAEHELSSLWSTVRSYVKFAAGRSLREPRFLHLPPHPNGCRRELRSSHFWNAHTASGRAARCHLHEASRERLAAQSDAFHIRFHVPDSDSLEPLTLFCNYLKVMGALFSAPALLGAVSE